jgi:hypothetical protein
MNTVTGLKYMEHLAYTVYKSLSYVLTLSELWQPEHKPAGGISPDIRHSSPQVFAFRPFLYHSATWGLSGRSRRWA